MDRLYAVAFFLILAWMPVAGAAHEFAKDRLYPELPRSRVESSVAEYLRKTREWAPEDYKVERSGGDRKAPVILRVTYLVETKGRLPEGKVLDLHLDAVTGEVIAEDAVE